MDYALLHEQETGEIVGVVVCCLRLPFFLEQKVGVSATALRRIRPRAGRSR